MAVAVNPANALAMSDVDGVVGWASVAGTTGSGAAAVEGLSAFKNGPEVDWEIFSMASLSRILTPFMLYFYFSLFKSWGGGFCRWWGRWGAFLFLFVGHILAEDYASCSQNPIYT